MNVTQSGNSRYERKFLVETLDVFQVRMLIKRHPSLFCQSYPPRLVNNLYLDTEELDHYHDGASGAAERQKVRIRWYGEMLGEVSSPHLEVKIKRGLIGSKLSYPFPAFRLESGVSHRDFQEIVRTSDLSADLRHFLRGLRATLCNSYFRWYYATKDGRYRLTVDTRLTYCRVKAYGNRFLSRYTDDGHIIVEMKYDQPFELQSDRVAGYFPFRATRHSKYVTGIEAVYM